MALFGKKITEELEKQPADMSQEELKKHIDLLRDVLENTQSNIKKALDLIEDDSIDASVLLKSLEKVHKASAGFVGDSEESHETEGNQRVLEGVFNGEKMIAGDGVEYVVPANYASKSKLVEGDILKLTIRPDGSFVYKQIGPVDRKQVVAILAKGDGNDWHAIKGSQRWKLLTASVTYFHGQPGDEVVILIPKDGVSRSAAVENIIKINHQDN